MNPRRVYSIFLRQWYLIRGNATRFVQMFIWITVDILLWGFLSTYLSDVRPGFDFLGTLLGAMLLWDFLSQVMQGVTMSFFEDVWSRNFLNVFGSPLKMSEYIAGFVLASTLRGMLALAVTLMLAMLLFGLSVFVYGASLGLFVLILFLFGIALGIFGVALVLRLGPAAEWFVWPIPAILSPFVGVIYPLTVAPPWMQYLGAILPPSYVFTGIRTIVSGGTFPIQTLLFGAVLAFGYILLAYAFFLWVYRKAVRTGLIARYSAESVN